MKRKDLNDKNNVEMFTTVVRGGKAFAAEQKIRELKTTMSKLNAQKLKVTHTKITLNSSLNMNNTKSKKYGFLPEKIESKSLSNEKFRTMFNMFHSRLDRYNKKRYSAKKIKLRENLTIGEKVLV